jgi:DNA-binding HxlR family transcriptional regulator
MAGADSSRALKVRWYPPCDHDPPKELPMSLHSSKIDGAERCPIRDVLDRMGDRWSMLVLMTLDQGGTLRFGMLKSGIGDISQRMLSITLRRLEQDGLVSRTAHATVPPRVDYALTPLGASFLEPMRGLLRWAEANHQQVRQARQAYVPPPRHEAL